MGKIVCAALLAACLAACGGGSGDDAAAWFAGRWQVRFNVVSDGCALLPQGQASFEDLQTISQDGAAISLQSQVLSSIEPAPFSGQTGGDDSFEAQVRNDNLDCGGTRCRLAERISYFELDGDAAQVLYDLELTLDDGTSCVSALRGGAQRQS